MIVSSDEEAIVILAKKIHGQLAGKIAEILRKRGEVTDDELAEQLGVNINTVRKILNQMFESRLVKYRRARDEKIGWYKYFWRLTDEPAHQLLEDRKRKTIRILERRLRQEEATEYFYCPKCGRKYTLDEADMYGYMCPHCEEVLEPYDNEKDILILRKTIERLQQYNPLSMPQSTTDFTSPRENVDGGE